MLTVFARIIRTPMIANRLPRWFDCNLVNTPAFLKPPGPYFFVPRTFKPCDVDLIEVPPNNHRLKLVSPRMKAQLALTI